MPKQRLTQQRALLEILLFVILAALIVLGPQVFSASYTYHRWDNLEVNAPGIKWAHLNWLHGQLPRVNLHQHLGEPFAANIQAGVYYPIYFIATALTQAGGWSDANLLELILVLNFAIGIGGFFHLARHFNLPPLVGLALACAATGGAYNLAYAGVWVMVTSIYAWLPWCMLGLLRFRQGDARGGRLFALASGLLGLVGHPQFWCYAQLMFALLALFLFWRAPRLLLRWAAVQLGGVLLALPVMLPMLQYLPLTARSEHLSLPDFLALSADFPDLAGLLWPLWGSTSSALTDQPVALLCYQGPHLLAFIALGQAARKDANNKHLWYALLLTALLVLALALGKNTPLYPLTFGLPVWSSFRWPSKLLLDFQFLMAMLALLACHLVLIQLHTNPWWQRARATLPHWGLTLAQAVFLLAVLASCIGFNTLIHNLDMKPYAQKYDAVDYGFDMPYRVMPTSVDEHQKTFRLSALGLGMAATENGYLSLTGYTHPQLLRDYKTLVPAYEFGGLPRDWMQKHSQTRLLDFLGVKYILAHLPDDQVLFEASPHFRLARQVGDVKVYENLQAMPLAFFLSTTLPGIDWQRPPVQAQVTGMVAQDWGNGRLTHINYRENGDIVIEGVSEGRGIVATTTAMAPGWQVVVNGASATPPLLVNGIAMGVVVEPGPFAARFSYTPPGLLAGWLAAAFGLFLVFVSGRRRHAIQ